MMAPEQLEGQEADARSDIFSFGAVVYEMITGRRPFESPTQAGVIANIMSSHPPEITAVVPQAPPALEQLARVCLAKDPADRRQTMRDVLTGLNWISGSTSRPDTPKPATATRRLPVWLWQAAAAVLAAGTIASIAASRLRTIPTPDIIRFTIPPPAKATFNNGLALSPDGKQLAFVATPQGGQDLLWIRALDSLDSRPVPGTDGAQFPFWSPDSRAIAFFAQGKLKRLGLPAGAVQDICDVSEPRGGAWGPDGTILVAPKPSSPLQRVSVSGGAKPHAVFLRAFLQSFRISPACTREHACRTAV